MLKKIVIAAAVLFVAAIATLAVLTYVTPTAISVEREITINRPKDDVFAYAKMMRSQNEWGPWFKKDPAMKQEFRGTDGTPGFVVSWASENADVGSGEQEIKKVVEGERIDSELRFKEPFASRADAYLTTDAVSDQQTRVKWGFSSEMPRPFNLMCLVVDMDQMIGKDFEDGLGTMKSILER